MSRHGLIERFPKCLEIKNQAAAIKLQRQSMCALIYIWFFGKYTPKVVRSGI